MKVEGRYLINLFYGAWSLCFDCKDVAVNTVRMCSLIDPERRLTYLRR